MTWMPRRFASRRRVPAHGGAVQLDVAGVGLVSAGDDLCQGRFPGAVFADQRVDLTGFDLEIDLAERLHAGKRLRDLLQPEHLSPQAQRGWQDCVCRPHNIRRAYSVRIIDLVGRRIVVGPHAAGYQHVVRPIRHHVVLKIHVGMGNGRRFVAFAQHDIGRRSCRCTAPRRPTAPSTRPRARRPSSPAGSRCRAAGSDF